MRAILTSFLICVSALVYGQIRTSIEFDKIKAWKLIHNNEYEPAWIRSKPNRAELQEIFKTTWVAPRLKTEEKKMLLFSNHDEAYKVDCAGEMFSFEEKGAVTMAEVFKGCSDSEDEVGDKTVKLVRFDENLWGVPYVDLTDIGGDESEVWQITNIDKVLYKSGVKGYELTFSKP